MSNRTPLIALPRSFMTARLLIGQPRFEVHLKCLCLFSLMAWSLRLTPVDFGDVIILSSFTPAPLLAAVTCSKEA